MAHIGFIGLGHMGLPMATALLKAGHEVIGFDKASEPMNALKAVGGRIASSLKAAVTNQDIVITMLQTGEQVKSVTEGATGLFETMSAGTLYIDCSTIDVETSVDVHESARVKKLFMVDAPVSGGVKAAEDASLTFMVGGEVEGFKKAEPVLEAMGKQVLYMGLGGRGVAAKICNNMILGISMVSVSEAFLLADKLGLSAKKLHESVTKSSGNCWVMDKYVPVPDVLPSVPANDEYHPGFSSAMMLKDLKLASDASEATGIRAGLGAFALALYEEAGEQIQSLDFSSIYQYIKDQTTK